MQPSATVAAKPLPSLLAKASQVEWDVVSQHPREFEVENLRRRGIDILKISWTPAAANKSLFGIFGSSTAKQKTTLGFIDRQIRIDEQSNGKSTSVAITYDDFTGAEFSGAAGKPKQSIKIQHSGKATVVGQGLSDEALRWLRDRILLETAGLVWKPLFNVGKRTTRVTANPDDQTYQQWKSGPNRLVALFLEHAPGHMSALEAGMEKGDLGSVRQNAHWLKSSSAAVGASLLSELFQRLEIDIDIKNETEVASLVHHISSEFRKVASALTRVTDAPAEGDAASASAQQRPEPSETGPLAGIKVLLVEDSLVNQEVALDCLHETGCSVKLANDGNEAVARFEAEPFDIILMDCQMSGMDGFQATRIIRDLEFKAGKVGLPIIALTAHALKGDREICLSAGMSDYISKPFVPDQLVAKIQEWLAAANPAPVVEVPVETEEVAEVEAAATAAEPVEEPVAEEQAVEPVAVEEDKSAA